MNRSDAQLIRLTYVIERQPMTMEDAGLVMSTAALVGGVFFVSGLLLLGATEPTWHPFWSVFICLSLLSAIVFIVVTPRYMKIFREREHQRANAAGLRILAAELDAGKAEMRAAA